jgi:hypothetical protein
MEHTPEREANTAVLNQIGDPPPASVLSTLIALTPSQPQHVAAFRSQADNSSTWRLVAIAESHLVEVTGKKEAPDWRGGTMRDDGQGDVVGGYLFHLRTLESVRYAVKHAYRSYEGLSTRVVGEWTFTFAGGQSVVLDETEVNSSTQATIEAVVQAVKAAS